MFDNHANLVLSNHSTAVQDAGVIVKADSVNTEQPMEAKLVAIAFPPSVRRGAWPAHHERLSTWLRWVCLLSGIVSLALLATARSLVPSPLGHGTHQQLGLPPCTVVLLWNTPCPACGMTTSWALATRGDFVAAARSNVGGLLLAIIALAFFPASCYFFATGQATRGYWFSTWLTVSLATALTLAVVQWLMRLLG
jgi:hypothetical protein